MAPKSDGLEDRLSGANLQMEGHMDVPSQSAKDPRELGGLGSSPCHSLSWSPARRPLSNCPNTRHCLEIHVTLTEKLGAVPPLSHAWTAPLVEDMLCNARTSLTEAVVMGPCRSILFYGRHLLGEGLTLDEARDAAFLFTRVGTWVGKPAYLAADPMTIQEGQWAITQAITDCWVMARGPGHPQVNLLTQQPFRFDHWRDFPMKDTPEDVSPDCQLLPHWPSRGWDCNRCWRDHRQPLHQLLSPSLDCGFESDRNSVSTALLMLSMSDRSEGSWHSQCGRQHGKDGAHMKINLPVFKRWGHYRCCDLPELEVGFNSILTCRVQGLHPPYHMPSGPYRVIPVN